MEFKCNYFRRNKKRSQNDTDEELKKNNKFFKDITANLNAFSYNKIIANLYEVYSFLYNQIKNLTQKILC